MACEFSRRGGVVKMQSKSVSASTTGAVVVKPDAGYTGLDQVSVAQVERLQRIASIVQGEPWVRPWSKGEWVVPEEPEDLEEWRDVVARVARGEGLPAQAWEPVLTLGGSSYELSVRLVTWPLSARLERDIDPDALRPGDVVRLVPGENDDLVTALLE